MKSLENVKKGLPIEDPEFTNLDKAIDMWNSLITHRTIDCKDGMNLTANVEDNVSYPAVQMSDGEKVMLFLIAQVLQAPQDGFIIIDEPEMYLHKTVLNKLWDILEKERQDCLFIYLTHDLTFASSRTSAKKIWIRSFKHPNNWQIEELPENEIPEALLMELLGSRKNILFCEGQKGSIDEKVYAILYPELTITPVGSCFEVINHTKAFNRIPNIGIKSYGLIDSDHHKPERLVKLQTENIYLFSVAEVENLFLDEDFLEIIVEKTSADKDAVKKIKKDIIEEFKNNIELQTSNYVSAKINYFFSNSHVTKGNTIDAVKNNYNYFTEEIDIDKWYGFRKSELEKIIEEDDYSSVIKVFNHKGLKTKASKYLKVSDFTDRSLRILKNEDESKKTLYKYFPQELKGIDTL